MDSVLVLNGPNLNLLGTREPDIYGTETLADIRAKTEGRAAERGLDIDFRQSNAEHELIEWIQAAKASAAGIILNAGAFTHTSLAIADALAAVGLPVVEVHLSNIFRREHFRHHSHMSRLAEGVICGFGSEGYVMAVDAMAHVLARKKKTTVRPRAMTAMTSRRTPGRPARKRR
jgi:3-dehydroquinate dehydratase-2